MTGSVNCFGQPVGFPLDNWQPRPFPQSLSFQGRTCCLVPFDAGQHAAALYDAYAQAADGRDWTWMFAGPFASEADYLTLAQQMMQSRDPLHFTVIDGKNGKPVGTLALMRIVPEHGVMEVGHVAFSPLLQRTVMATEAHYLLMRYAFDDLGYRRYEWKCDSCNQPSRRAALRLGFQFEGTFRQAMVYKGRSRDTSWFSVIDSDWPRVKQGFERWLAEDNFTAEGAQREKLEIMRGG
jgi:RimJ/RimL family protein N-acetyltransferase